MNSFMPAIAISSLTGLSEWNGYFFSTVIVSLRDNIQKYLHRIKISTVIISMQDCFYFLLRRSIMLVETIHHIHSSPIGAICFNKNIYSMKI